MNLYRSTVRRRQLLKSGSLAALGVLGSALASQRLFSYSAPSEQSRLVPEFDPARSLARKEPAPTCEEEDMVEAAPDADFVEPRPQLRPLSREEEYADFLASLGLRHIAPHEVIDPHRGVCNGVNNELPPERYWKKLTPTLRVADEIRERLGVPLVKFSSAYRSPNYNSRIPGAVRHSYHTRNQALDVVYYCPVRDAYNMAVKLRSEGFFRGGIGLYPTFIHLDTRGYNASWRG